VAAGLARDYAGKDLDEEYFVTAEAGGYAATGIAFTIEAGAAGAVDTTVMNIILWPPSPVAGTRSGRP
jgi:hypothetical protein